jgi:predicted transcriptional regulator
MPDDPELRRLLWYLLGATRGGENRARIIHALRERPGNVNQLSTRLTMEYRLVTHHMDVLVKNSVVQSSGDRYGRTYFVAPWLESHFDLFEAITRQLKFKLD